MVSTLPERRDVSEVRRARTLRRIGLTVLAVWVLMGAVGLLGTYTATKKASSGEYELTVTYPRISRPGHAVQVQVQVRREGGFQQEPVQLRYGSRWMDMLDENAFHPEPSAGTAGPGYTEEEFDPPRGDTFVLTVDSRIEPARQRGAAGWFSVVDGNGTSLVRVDVDTWIWP